MALDRSKIEEAQAELEKLLEEGIGLTGKKAADHKLKVSRKRKELRQMEKQKASDALGKPLGESSAIDQKSEERIAAEREIKDQSQKDVRDEQVNAMDKLRIGGKSTVRQEVDKQGRTKYRDEGSGRYANEEAYEDSENRISMLANSIKRGSTMGRVSTTTKATQFGVSSAAAKISRNLGDNAGAIQEMIDKADPGTQDELRTLMGLMKAASSDKIDSKQARELKQQIIQQRETVRLTAGEQGDELISKLGMDTLQKDLNKGSRIKDALNIDQDATGFKAIKQAFSPTRLFGDPNTGGLSNFYTAGQQEAVARKNAAVEFDSRRQNEGLNNASELLEVTKKEAKDDDKKEQREIKQAKKEQAAREGFDGGVLKEDYAEQQVTLLEEIRDILERMSAGAAGGGGGGGGGLLGTAAAGGAGAGIFAAAKGKLGSAVKGAKNLGGKVIGGARAVGGKLLSGAGKLLRGRAGLITAGAALVGYGASKIFGGGDDEQGDALESQTFSSEEDAVKVGGVVVEQNGVPRTDFTKEELQQINAARQASIQMGGTDPYPAAQGLEPTKRGMEIPRQGQNVYQAEAEAQTPQQGEEGAGLELPSSGAVAATGAAGATVAGMGSGDAALTATMARGGKPAAQATSFGGRMLSGLKTAGRVVGKVALPVTAGLAAYDAYKGFNADENASFGDKLKNAGSSVLSGLTFGLLGKSADETAAQAVTNGPPMEPESGDGDSDSSGGETTEGKAVANSHPETGDGFQPLDPEGNPVVDAQGRPAIFTKENAEAFSAMMADSDGAVKGSDIASSQRSVEKNAAVGGAARSKHMTGSAMDIHGTSNTWIRQNGSEYGWRANDYSGSHGGHFIAASGGPLPSGAALAAAGPMMSSGGGGGSSAPTRRSAALGMSAPSGAASLASASSTPTTVGSIQPTQVAESPTGPAVENMTTLASNNSAVPPAPVINNITNNTNGSSGASGPNPVGVHPRLTSQSTIERFIDRRFYG